MAIANASKFVVNALQGYHPYSFSPLGVRAAYIHLMPFYKMVYTSGMIALCGLSFWEPIGKLNGFENLPLVRGLDVLLICAHAQGSW